MKRCNKCSTEKPLDNFSKSPNTKDRLQIYCKQCVSLYMKEYSKKNSKRIVGNINKWRKDNPGCRKQEWAKTYNRVKNNPVLKKKRNARGKVNYAKRFQGLKSGECCCSSFNWECKGMIESHHWDYDRPMDIEWVCKKHHLLLDKVQKCY